VLDTEEQQLAARTRLRSFDLAGAQIGHSHHACYPARDAGGDFR
jgi:hypothetical protein